MDDFTDSIFKIMTSQTGINRYCQKWIPQVAFRKSSFWFLISQLWISDFQGLLLTICDYWILVSDFWFLNSEFKFQSSNFWISISNIGLMIAWKSNISYLKYSELRTEWHLIYDFLDFRIRKTGWPQSILIESVLWKFAECARMPKGIENPEKEELRY